MNEIRVLIQSTLDGIEDIEISAEMPNDLLEENKTYFTYTIRNSYTNSDFDNNYSMKPNVIGYVKRIIQKDENTLEIVDNASKAIIEALKEINFRANVEDVSLDGTGIQKQRITASALYNEINNKLV